MITNKFTIYTKYQKLALSIIEIVQGVVGLILTTFVFIALFVNQNMREVDIWFIIMGIAGIISLVELIIRKTFNKHSFLYNLLIKRFKKNISLFPQTKMQAEVCSWINTKIQNGKGILIYGKADIGKTSSVFIYLSQHTKDKDLLQKLNWVESVIYIDCKNNKSDVLDFFCNDDKSLSNIMYEKSLIIVDNLETMGKTFWENLLYIINASTGTFILLADANKLDNAMYDSLEAKFIRDNYSLSVDDASLTKFKYNYESLNDNEKTIFLVIYYLSLSMTLIPINDIFSLVKQNCSFFRFRLTIYALLHKNLIKTFPFDSSYFILADRINVVKNQIIFWDTEHNLNAIFQILHNSDRFPESAWLSLIHLPYKQLSMQNTKQREILFSNALKCGNYVTLYNALYEEINYCPQKESIFFYEYGTLCFYNSHQDLAFEKYNQLIEKGNNDDVKYATMLRIIEATHGDVNVLTTQNINKYINILKSYNNRYALYATYWMLHIKSERGKFSIEEYLDLLKGLTDLKDIETAFDIHTEIVKRCYTDIIRCSHILQLLPSKTLTSDFFKFMQANYDKTMVDYYTALYVKANSLHYVTLLDEIVNGRNCQDTFDKACSYYEIALRNGIEKQKSVSACELKYIDLKLFNPENLNEFSNYQTKIMKFLSNAEINKVSVHVAYCKTLLAKLYIVKTLQSNDFYVTTNKKEKNSNIKSYLREAKKIYKEYKNDYGVVRIEFIENLYLCATLGNKVDIDKLIIKMSDISELHQEYQREKTIVNFLKNNYSSTMSIISIIKAYPIIMQ
ncbi:MAG: hypothetical protein K1W41_00375 [Lachnospiraceae bacterium]|mgnify:CR=1 FL=1